MKLSKFSYVLQARCWTMIFGLIDRVSSVWATKFLHYKVTGRRLNLRAPRKFDEKLQWLKLYYKNPLVVECADKLSLKEYAKRRGFECFVVETISVYENAKDIDWSILPDSFAIKCNHGSGYNIIVKDKALLDKQYASRRLNKWLGDRYGRKKLEYHYDNIRPKIFAERLIDCGDIESPLDYKVYCFNGRPEVILVCARIGSVKSFAYFNTKWQSVSLMAEDVPVIVDDKLLQEPECLDAMLACARELSSPFPYVRVDFYIEKGRLLLGEMTFTPSANMDDGYSGKGLRYLGELLHLPDV